MRWVTQHWYRKNSILGYSLSPLAYIYEAITIARKQVYQRGIKTITRFPVPVIVVGNVTVGGTGKTPFVAWLVDWLKSQGKNPGLVSRGYGGKAPIWPQTVLKNSDPRWVGDEPVMLVRQTQCPMIVGPDRVAAVKQLLENYDCDVIISDDGLQHYALGRDIEIAVMDGSRRCGNGFCLPAGPLRESKQRLRTVNFVVTNGVPEANEYAMQYLPGDISPVNSAKQALDPTIFSKKTVHAVAGIGHPQRFFDLLKKLGIQYIPHEFPDHYCYKPSDLDFGEDTLVIMTEKDAVKCRRFADERHWYLPITAAMDDSFKAALASVIPLDF